MTYDRRHILAQWGGTLPGSEIWSNSVRLSSVETGDNAALPTHDQILAWCQGPAKDAVAAFHSAPATHGGMGAKLTYLKMNVVGMDGRYIDPNTIEYVYPTPPIGNSNGFVHPTQVTLCVSLTTGLQRGYAHRGRFYLPLPSIGVSATTGLISTADASDVAASAATFIKALSDQIGVDGLLEPNMVVSVMSKRGGGATHEVTGTAVGLVLDTQVRRRNALKENYQTAAVAQ